MSSREVDGSDYLWRDVDAPRGAEPIGPGVVLGDRYRVLNVAGRGGFGAVMVAYDERLHREVAIKVAADTTDVARLVREAEVTAHLDHPGIVAVHDVGLDAHGRPWYAMRVVRGQAAAQVFAQRRERGLHVLMEAAEAVAHAHRRGVAHGDLSPANIMVGEHGEVQVVDWGLAEKCDGEPSTHRPAGTPRYMSRDRLAGARPSRHGDVYALGMMLRELGEFRVGRREVAAIATQATSEGSRRYPDAGAFARDLRNFSEGRVVGALDYRFVDHVARWWRARRAVMVTALVGFIVVTAIAISSVHALVVERDAAIAAQEEARRHLGESLRQRALELAQRGEDREALAVARQARAIAETPDTLGVIAAFAGSATPTLVEATGLPRCRRVGRGEGGLWCDEGDQLTWWTQGTPVHRAGRFRDVVMLAEHVVATTFDDRLVASTLTGNDLPPLTTLGTRNLHAGPDDRLALAWEAYYIELIEPGAAVPYRRLDMCTHDHPITAVACTRSPGLVCAAACEGGDIDELVVADGHHGKHDAGADVAALALTPDLGRVIGYRRGGVSFVAHDGRVHWHIATADGVSALELSRSGRWALLVDEREHRQLVSLATGDVTTPVAPALTTGGLVFAGDELVAFGVMATRWQIARRPTTLHAALGVSALAISSDGALLARGDRESVAIIDATSGEVLRTVTPVARMVKALAFEPGSHDLAIAVTDAPRVVVVDADTGAQRAEIVDASSAGFRRVGWLGRTLVAASYREAVMTLDRKTNTTRTWPLPQEVVDMSFGPDAVVMIDRVGSVLRFDGVAAPTVIGRVAEAHAVVAANPVVVARGAQLVGLDGVIIADLGAPIGDLVSTPTTLIAGLASGAVVVIDPTAPQTPRWSFMGHRDRVATLVPAGETLWSAGWDGVVRRYVLNP